MPHVMTADRFDGQAGLRVSTIDFSHPWEWLRKGWADIRTAPGYSLTYGTGIVLLSLLITTLMILGELTFLVPFLIAGFFLMAPMLSIGLYQMSAHLERVSRWSPVRRWRPSSAIRASWGWSRPFCS
jgi:uncharacterized membrane protein